MKPTIRDVRRCYSKIKQLARTAISERDYNRAAGELALSARIAYLFNWIYSDPETDDMIRRIGRALFDEKSPEPRQTARYAMYNSFGRENRGLTQQYIRALRALQVEFLYIFEDRSKAMAGVESDLAACGDRVEIFEITPSLPPTKQAEQLHRKLREYAPQVLLVQIAPWSVMPLIAFSALPEIAKYNINLTDHAFWLGSGIFDRNIEFRDFGWTISLEKRRFAMSQLFMLPYYPILNETPFEGFPAEVPADSVKIFSGGSYYKVYGGKGLYFDLVKRTLDENPDAVLLYAGDGDARIFREFIRSNGFQRRVFLLGSRRDINAVFRACDIYMGTYPIGGGLMSQYAAVNGKPILAYASEECPSAFVETVVCHKTRLKITHTDVESFARHARALCSDPALRIEEGNRLKQCITSPDEFAEGLRNLLAGYARPHSGNRVGIDYGKRLDFYYETENSNRWNGFAMLLLSQYGIWAFRYFPLAALKTVPGTLYRYGIEQFKKYLKR